jgi:hypothetical protein
MEGAASDLPASSGCITNGNGCQIGQGLVGVTHPQVSSTGCVQPPIEPCTQHTAGGECRRKKETANTHTLTQTQSRGTCTHAQGTII